MTPAHRDTYELHGLRIRSQIPLAEESVPAGGADVDIRTGAERHVGDDAPPGEVVVQFTTAERPWYTGVRQGDGYLLRVHRRGDFSISADLRRVECHPDPDAGVGTVSVILGGTVLAFLLLLRGEFVLHASAAVTRAGAVALLGHSGMGKSTMASLLCAHGAPLVGDDLLVLRGLEPAECLRGSRELRLRHAARPLLEEFPVHPPHRTTADGRLAIAPAAMVGRSVPLASIVVPRPSRRASTVEVRAVPRPKVPWILLSYPRLLGWQRKQELGAWFQRAVDLARSVPVYEAVIPWGPPFADSLVDDLLDGVTPAPAAPERASA